MIEKLNAILNLFTPERPEWIAADVAQALSIPRSTSYRLLSRIAGAGFIDNDRATGSYRLGLRLAALGMLAQRSTLAQRAAYAVLHRLAWELQETAMLMTRSGAQAEVVLVVDGPRTPLLLSAPGMRQPLYATAGGRAMMSTLPDEERRTLVRSALLAGALQGAADAAGFEAELVHARDAGWCVAHGPWLTMDCVIAAPVRQGLRSASAAILIAGQRSRLTDARVPEVGALLVSAAAQVATALRTPEKSAAAGANTQRTAAD